jgi:hypothetical protein
MQKSPEFQALLDAIFLSASSDADSARDRILTSLSQYLYAEDFLAHSRYTQQAAENQSTQESTEKFDQDVLVKALLRAESSSTDLQLHVATVLEELAAYMEHKEERAANAAQSLAFRMRRSIKSDGGLH